MEFLFIALLILANGILAMAEIAVVSARKTRLQQRAAAGDPRAQAALALANSPTRFLSTVQIGITLVGVLAGAFGGATIAQEIAGYFAAVPALAPYGEVLAIGLVVFAITYLSLVLGELVPKRLALHNPEGIAALVATPMQALSAVAAPAVHLLTASTELVLRVLRVRTPVEPPVSDEEITLLIEQGIQAGVFEEAEREIIENVFRLSDRRVASLMTPRREVDWLNAADDQEHIASVMATTGHTYFPVCRGDLENVMGIIAAKDAWPLVMAGHGIDWDAALRRPLFVSETLPALRLLKFFRQVGIHLALVVDEYGTIQGLVTLHDVLEAIVGNIPLAEELAHPSAVQRDDGSWLLDGLVPIHEFKDIFDLRTVPGEERGDFHTLGGFVMDQIGHVPATGERFEWGTLRFEVMDMDEHRVDKVLVTPTAP